MNLSFLTTVKNKTYAITFALIAITLLWIQFVNVKWKDHQVLKWDMYGYSMYLSSTFIYHDIKHLEAFNRIDTVYMPADSGYGRHIVTNGNYAFKYTMGNAMMYAPFYLTAHVYTKLSGSYPADGYSVPYQFAVSMSTFFWAMLALFMTLLVLRRWFSDTAVMVTILIVALATNFFYYATIETGLTHIPSMFWLACVIYFSLRWSDTGKWKYAWLTGICMGIIALIRLPDMVFGVIPGLIFFEMIRRPNARIKALLLQGMAAALAAAALFSLQLIYWKYITGDWIHFSYIGEGFSFGYPEIYNGLLSYKKGWLVYTPVMIFALIGLPFVLRKNKWLGIGFILYTIINIYVVFCWRCWWYGGGFGARSLIQTYIVCSFGLAAFIDFVVIKGFSLSKPIIKVACLFICVVALMLATLNLFQTYQYTTRVMHWEDMSRESYWYIFGKTQLSEEEKMKLYPPH